jgi:hypothetical protein
MIPKKPVPDLIRDGNRFSDQIVLELGAPVAFSPAKLAALARLYRISPAGEGLLTI